MQAKKETVEVDQFFYFFFLRHNVIFLNSLQLAKLEHNDKQENILTFEDFAKIRSVLFCTTVIKYTCFLRIFQRNELKLDKDLIFSGLVQNV